MQRVFIRTLIGASIIAGATAVDAADASDGEKTIRVPNGVPIVTMKPGDRSLLTAGAKVIVTEQVVNGQPVAARVLVGRNGFEPPM